MVKIIIKDNHVQDAKTKDISVISAAAKDYEGEIADRIAKDPRLKDFDVFQLAMMDAGIFKSSQIKDFMATSDNRWLFPVFIDRTLRDNVNKSDIMQYVISGSPVSVPSLSAQGAYIDLASDEDNKDAVKKKRVAEGSSITEYDSDILTQKRLGTISEGTSGINTVQMSLDMRG